MRLGITDTVKHLIIINVIVFIGMMTIGNNGDLFNQWFALYTPKSENFNVWQIFTHMFMHSNQTFAHILFNMFGLWMFGTAVEQRLGNKKFLFLYISSGLGAVLLTFIVYYFQVYQDFNVINNLGLSKEIVSEIINLDIVNSSYRFDSNILYNKLNTLFLDNNLDGSIVSNEVFASIYNVNAKTNVTMVGASGCIMGILAAFGMMNPNAELMLIFLPIPIKAKYFIPGIIILDVISAFTGQSFFSPSNTAYAAHIGGAITGFLIMWYWKKNSMNKYRWN
ncbi:rhomboid family intramembrane serine protease [uncultured Winogradskyella sp.]|uniref:rhomboid family intramembrane serine protease n=1 Tax=uncultured Winogradskyella sp. TaxID=395353 RepID=UPI0026358DCA|nr:rhomboid family intramembrane serine protease [uncultured Winogradskyella sp.]